MMRFPTSDGVSYPLGVIDLEVTMGESGRTRTVLMEFAVVDSPSPYNVILGRMGMRSLGAVASTIHSMMRFPTSDGVATVMTSREMLRECRKIEEGQCSSRNARVSGSSLRQTIPGITGPGNSSVPMEIQPQEEELHSRRPGKEPRLLDNEGETSLRRPGKEQALPDNAKEGALKPEEKIVQKGREQTPSPSTRNNNSPVSSYTG
ncbi:hypothetical protein CTI12_AA336940 [Artemisia annua]|uniref:Reverse transcriptase domain-containing protein n=1 Tax=Artemisia annua TaxID=35608 RepID=A0A2U1MVW9_ARTAN|nr:hypothetical protein CTI12_AA336940 [Artemisia annua]